VAALLTFTGIAATAARADAQVNHPYVTGTTNYSNPVQAGSYLTYYAPQSNLYAPQATYSSFYTPTLDASARTTYTPVRAWDGGWTVSGYTSPALQYYNSYRATQSGFRR
jgi:hypothetical protein